MNDIRVRDCVAIAKTQMVPTAVLQACTERALAPWFKTAVKKSAIWPTYARRGSPLDLPHQRLYHLILELQVFQLGLFVSPAILAADCESPVAAGP